MGAMKRWAQDVHDDCLSIGVHNTSTKYDISHEDVKTTTINHLGWEQSWSSFMIEYDLKKTMRNLDAAAKKRGL